MRLREASSLGRVTDRDLVLLVRNAEHMAGADPGLYKRWEIEEAASDLRRYEAACAARGLDAETFDTTPGAAN